MVGSVFAAVVGVWVLQQVYVAVKLTIIGETTDGWTSKVVDDSGNYAYGPGPMNELHTQYTVGLRSYRIDTTLWPIYWKVSDAGRPMPVVFDPNDPSNARIKSFLGVWTPAILLSLTELTLLTAIAGETIAAVVAGVTAVILFTALILDT